jgi:ABC-type polar amino acid transport system ATPase subunit
MISVRDLTYIYGDGTVALDKINVEFTDEHISAILGESGSGKTSLLRCIGRFLTPTRGNILYFDRNIADMPEPEFRQAIGIVFQRLHLFPHLSVLKNMTLALQKVQGKSLKESREMAMGMLERLGIQDLADSYPSQISGGQAQRAAIARGLVLKPGYILLDEPTSALDANTTDDFAMWLKELKEDTNLIIVTHDILFARKVATRGVYLSEGHVLDTGRIDDIIEHVRAGGLSEVNQEV